MRFLSFIHIIIILKPYLENLCFFGQFIKHPHFHERGDEGLPPQNVHAHFSRHPLIVVDGAYRALALAVSHVATTGFQQSD